MSKRKITLLLLGAWLLVCIVWFSYILLNENKKPSASSAKQENLPASASTGNITASVPDVVAASSTAEKSDTAEAEAKDVSPVLADSSDAEKETMVSDTSAKETGGDNSSAAAGSKEEDATESKKEDPSATSVKEQSATGGLKLRSKKVWRYHFRIASDKNVKKAATARLLAKIKKNLKNESCKLLITGHTDYTGSETYNEQLGLQRADAIKEYMQLKGIDPEKIQVESKGETEPIASNQTKKGRALNRRVELTIIYSDN